MATARWTYRRSFAERKMMGAPRGLSGSALAALLAGSLMSGAACAPERDYGKLVCFDSWPAGRTAADPRASLAITPAIVWQTNLASGYAYERGLALSGDRILANSGETLVALDRTSGAQAFAVVLSSNSSTLGPPSVDEQGVIHIQSPTMGVVSLTPDGATLFSAGPSGYWTSGGDPAEGSGVGLVVTSAEVLAASNSDQEALDASGAELWHTTYGSSIAIGHWGFGFDGSASYAVDLRSGQPAGRLRADDGEDVQVMAPLAGRGIVTFNAHIGSALRLDLLDTCGRAAWSLKVRDGCARIGGGVVGLGETIFMATQSCSNPTDSSIIGVAPDGRIVSGPVARQEGPWFVGADGTVYAVWWTSAPSLAARLAALSPALEELWHLDLPGAPVGMNPLLTDDGLLYMRIGTTQGDAVIAVQTTSPGLAPSSWPMPIHDNRASNWGGGPF